MRKQLIILLLTILFSCEKEDPQIDFRDRFIGEYCCEVTTFNFLDSPTYDLCIIEVQKGQNDSAIVITINKYSYTFVFIDDYSIHQNAYYPKSGRFYGDSLDISIIFSHTHRKSYKGKKFDSKLPEYFESSISDIEGNSIKTITIGGMTWMAENLSVSHDKNGNEVPLNSYESISENCGNVYTLEVGQDVCPIGWRIPSKEEWDNLIKEINNYPECYVTDLINIDFIDLFNLKSRCYDGHPFEAIESDISNAFWSSSVEEYNKEPFHVYFESYNNNYDSLYYRVLCEGLEDNDKLFIRCIKVN